MRSMVEGLVGRHLCHDVRDGGCHVFEDELRRKAKYADILAGQPPISNLIARRTVAAIMRFAIDLDRVALARTVVVEDVGTSRMLWSELQARRSLPQRLPQQHLRQRHFLPQVASAGDGLHRPGQPATSPSTSLRLVPLPVPGRNCGPRPGHHIRNTPNAGRSGIGALRVAAKARPRTSRVCAGSMMPSSHSRAVACHGLPSSS